MFALLLFLLLLINANTQKLPNVTTAENLKYLDAVSKMANGCLNKNARGLVDGVTGFLELTQQKRKKLKVFYGHMILDDRKIWWKPYVPLNVGNVEEVAMWKSCQEKRKKLIKCLDDHMKALMTTAKECEEVFQKRILAPLQQFFKSFTKMFLVLDNYETDISYPDACIAGDPLKPYLAFITLKYANCSAEHRDVVEVMTNLFSYFCSYLTNNDRSYSSIQQFYTRTNEAEALASVR